MVYHNWSIFRASHQNPTRVVRANTNTNSSRSGFYMSELLYLFGELDYRVRPLVFTIRRWAKDQGLIQDLRPTPSFTNFSVTLLVLFFLQKKYGMLPPIRELQQYARKYCSKTGLVSTVLYHKY